MIRPVSLQFFTLVQCKLLARDEQQYSMRANQGKCKQRPVVRATSRALQVANALDLRIDFKRGQICLSRLFPTVVAALAHSVQCIAAA